MQHVKYKLQIFMLNKKKNHLSLSKLKWKPVTFTVQQFIRITLWPRVQLCFVYKGTYIKAWFTKKSIYCVI